MTCRRLHAVVDLAGLILTVRGTHPCLPDAVPAELRQFILQDGREVPLTVWRLNWASASIAESIFRHLSEEVLGFHVATAGPGASSSTCLYALAGCRDPNNYHVNPACGEAADADHVQHVCFEVWQTAAVDRLQGLQTALPSRAPERLGSMGYPGMETLFVPSSTRSAAYAKEGVPLEYYLSYNLRWHNPGAYFDSYDSIPRAMLKPCNETNLMNSIDLTNYLQTTGDLAGVQLLTSGAVVGKCWFDAWWLGPACRHQPELCVPVITGGDGWFLYAFLHAAATHEMPLAVATAASWNAYLEVPARYKVLLYWWTPDTSFVDLAPIEVIFPQFDEDKWAGGDKSSVAQRVVLTNWAHKDLSTRAHSAYHLASNLRISSNDMEALLLEMKTQGTAVDDLACSWLRNNTDIWQKWVPLATACALGQGIVDAAGNFVDTRELASSCDWCQPGFMFQPLNDEFGTTYTCTPCPPGTSQPKLGQTSCNQCAPGTSSDTWGTPQCPRCPEGTYQPEFGGQNCLACRNSMTTAGFGSAHESECACRAGSYRPLGSNTCSDCPLGMTCAFGSDAARRRCKEGEEEAAEEEEKASANDFRAVPFPVPSQQHFASCEEPETAYKCLHKDACPGGGLGLCGPGFLGFTCGRCEQGLRPVLGGSKCAECSLKGGSAAWLLLPLGVILGLGPPAVWAFHKLTASRSTTKLSTMDHVFTACYLILVLCQIMAHFSQCELMLPSYISNLSFGLHHTIDLMSVFELDCIPVPTIVKFLIEVLLPVYVSVAFVLAYGGINSWRKARQQQALNTNVGISNFGGLFLAFFISIVRNTLAVFTCYQHPNGSASMRLRPPIICFTIDGEWLGLAFVALTGFVIFGIGGFSVLACAVWFAPTSMHSQDFRSRWRFLLVRFRPTTWWWGLVLILRGVLLSLATALFTHGATQLAYILLIIVLYAGAALTLLPWRDSACNVLDLCTQGVLTIICAVLFRFSTPGLGDETLLAVALGCLLPLPLIVAVGTVAAAACRKFRSEALAEKWSAQAEELVACFSQVNDAKLLARVLADLPGADVKLLRAVSQMLEVELHGAKFRRGSADAGVAPARGSGPFAARLCSQYEDSGEAAWTNTEAVGDGAPQQERQAPIGDAEGAAGACKGWHQVCPGADAGGGASAYQGWHQVCPGAPLESAN